MKSAEWLTPEPIGKGSRLCYTTYTGMQMEVECRAYLRPKIVSIEMISDYFWLSQFGRGWQFRRIDAETTEVIFAYGFKAKRLKKCGEPVFAHLFAWESRRRLNKLKLFAEKHNENQHIL